MVPSPSVEKHKVNIKIQYLLCLRCQISPCGESYMLFTYKTMKLSVAHGMYSYRFVFGIRNHLMMCFISIPRLMEFS